MESDETLSTEDLNPVVHTITIEVWADPAQMLTGFPAHLVGLGNCWDVILDDVRGMIDDRYGDLVSTLGPATVTRNHSEPANPRAEVRRQGFGDGISTAVFAIREHLASVEKELGL